MPTFASGNKVTDDEFMKKYPEMLANAFFKN
jgi:hypothetical protein